MIGKIRLWGALSGALLLLAACAAAVGPAAGGNDAVLWQAPSVNGAPIVSGGANVLPGAGGVEETAPAGPDYRLVEVVDMADHTHKDGTILATYTYRWPRLEVERLEELSPEDRAAAELDMETFNARLQGMADAAREESQVAQYAQEAYEGGWTDGLPFYEDTSVHATICGRLISVRLDYYYNTGGAHPNYQVGSLLFDLDAAQFIEPLQVADDAAAFHPGLGQLLVEKAEGLGADYVAGYWPDYTDILMDWDAGDTAAVLFDDSGMTVLYPPYILGPYALGTVELRVEREELSPLIGPGGMAKLGWTATEEPEGTE